MSEEADDDGYEEMEVSVDEEEEYDHDDDDDEEGDDDREGGGGTAEDEDDNDSPGSQRRGEESHQGRLGKICLSRKRKGGQQPRKKRAGYHLTLEQKLIIVEQHNKHKMKGEKLARHVATFPAFSKAPTRQAIHGVLKEKEAIIEANKRLGTYA
jgi:hypothetical protein